MSDLPESGWKGYGRPEHLNDDQRREYYTARFLSEVRAIHRQVKRERDDHEHAKRERDFSLWLIRNRRVPDKVRAAVGNAIARRSP